MTINKNKKFVAVTLVCLLLINIFGLTAFAQETDDIYRAQVLHSTGVNEYGTNIRDVGIAEYIYDLPLSISFVNKNLNISGTISGKPFSLIASIRGTNELGNMIYFDVNEFNSYDFEVMSIIYMDSFSQNSAIVKDKSDGFNSVLKLYLKDITNDEREYFFIEVFGFSINNYETIVSDINKCESDYWYANEFLPIDTAVEEREIVAFADTYERYFTISMKYVDPSLITYYQQMVVFMVHDITDIPKSQTAMWIHSFQVYSKSSLCPQEPSFGDSTASAVIIDALELKAMTPKNTAFISTQIDGNVFKSGSFGVDLSASLAYKLSTKLASLSLGIVYDRSGNVDINNTFTGYINSESQGYTRSLNVSLDSRYSLRNVGDYFQVTNMVRDYGNKSTSSETIYFNWSWTAMLLLDYVTTNGTQSEAVTCRVI